jgi:peptide/nickel transport system ATP-binding protein
VSPVAANPDSFAAAGVPAAARPLLDIRDLSVAFPGRGGWVPVVRGASLAVARGEMVGLVGESGSGKTMTALSVVRLVPSGARVTGRVWLDGAGEGGSTDGGDLLSLPERGMRRLRGRRIGFVFQEPMSALDPLYTIGFQIAEAVRAHRRISRREAREEVVRLLDRVALPDARRRLDDYPHQLSGGQRQRVGIAMALAGGPDLLLADEPTTALDVTLQAQVLELLARLRAELGLAVLLITHDLGIVADTCDRAVVMHRGEVVETADVESLFAAPEHPYTRRLLAALGGPHPRPLSQLPPAPRRERGDQQDSPSEPAFLPSPGDREGGAGRGAGGEGPLVEALQISREFKVRRGLLQRTRGVVRAVDRVDLTIRRGECLALVGESGSGKTTLGRCLIRLLEPTSGRVVFAGEDLLALRPRPLRALRRRFQMVFQDPYGSLDPRQKVGSILDEPLTLHTPLRPAERAAKVGELLTSVGLGAELADRWPHELSGGQRQRVGIARALAAGPDLLVADEPVSALDVSLRGQILDLLAGLRARLGLALLFISHDLGAVEQLADRVAVLYLGRIVEEAERDDLFRRPLHPYTVSLLSAVPGRGRQRLVLQGETPSPLAPPAGCPFHPRCPVARARCAAETPPLAAPLDMGEGRVACFYPGELKTVNIWGSRA